MGRLTGLGGALVVVLLTGCGGGGGGNDNPAPAPAPPPPPPAANTTGVMVDLTSQKVVVVGAPSGSATADFTIDLDDRTITGTVTLNGLTADGVTINGGFAGENGAVIVTMNEDSATQWSVPAGTALLATEFDDFNAGALYVQVTTATEPNGAVRGQLLTGNIEVEFTVLLGSQHVPPVASTGSATASMTVDPDTGDIVIHVNTSGLDDAGDAHIHRALAGLNGNVLIPLMQDSVTHWSATAMLDAAGLQALADGELYVNVHTPANLSGEVRGQITPDSVEVIFTQLVSGDVVIMAHDSSESAVAATTFDISTQVATIHLNTVNLDDATRATLNQAPVGQRGPVIYDLMRDPNAISHWMLEDVTLTESQLAAFENEGLYFQVDTPDDPMGAVRGQIVPPASSGPPSGQFQVTAIDPADGAAQVANPNPITVTFNKDVLASTTTTSTVTLTRSGGDGSFGDGNEIGVNLTGISTSGSTLTIDLTGAPAVDDVYQLTLDGTSMVPLTDVDGLVLDGDADGDAGGDFISTFTTVTPPPSGTTLAEIQAAIFTPTCAISGCHFGGAPQEGMNLQDGNTFINTVNVPSSQVPSLDRVEPFDSDSSYLVQKVEGTAAVGQRMPFGGLPLSQSDINMIRDWITNGAQNDVSGGGGGPGPGPGPSPGDGPGPTY